MSNFFLSPNTRAFFASAINQMIRLVYPETRVQEQEQNPSQWEELTP